jgi:hypothetical protein
MRLARIAEALGRPVSYFFGEDPPAEFDWGMEFGRLADAVAERQGRVPADSPNRLGNLPAFQEFAADEVLLASLGVTQEELAELAEWSGPRPQTKQAVASLVVTSRTWR